MKRSVLCAILLGISVGCADVTFKSTSNQNPIVLNDNGGWCWFESERAIIHDGVLYAGTVANGSGSNGAQRAGNIELLAHDLKSNQTTLAVLHEKLEADDHDSPGIYVRRDGRLLAMYSKHGGDNLCRWRISTRPGDISSWEPEQTLSIPSGRGYSYSNIYRMPAENNRLYNFFRGPGYNPNYLYSDDDGSTWTYGGRLLHSEKQEAGRTTDARPYLRYCSNGTDTIHFIATEGHPRDIDNSIYYGYLRGGKIYRSDGSMVGELSHESDTSIKPTDLTKIFPGDADNVAWTMDLRLDKSGHPRVLFSVQKNDGDKKANTNSGGEDMRYFYARWTGAAWQVNQLAYAGTRLYAPEVDYTGLGILHPYRDDEVYISTDADPLTGRPLISSADGKRHREIFKGTTRDDGATWKWTPVTSNSTRDNLRPIIPSGDPQTSLLLWLRGTFTAYTNYDLNVVAQPQ